MGRVTTRSPVFRAIMRGEKVEIHRTPADEYFKNKFSHMPVSNARPLSEAIQEGSWSGSRCFVIGGGPSIREFEFARLKGEKVIAINRAYENIPDADILFSMDSRYYQWIQTGRMGGNAKTAFDNFEGIKVWLNTQGFPYRDIHVVRSPGRRGLPESFDQGLYHGNNSGYGALQLAYLLGANPIILLGYDMKHEKGSDRIFTHYHSGYPTIQKEESVKSFRDDFNDLAPRLKAKGVRILNANPDSGLRCFEFCNLDKILK